MSSTPKRESSELIVVGGGAIGLAVAWRAAQHGYTVTLLDAGAIAHEAVSVDAAPAAPVPPRQSGPGPAASRVAAGMLAPISEAEGERPLLDLGLRSAARWPAFAEELAAAAGIDPGYRRCGTLLVARDADDAEALEHELAFRRELGLPVQRLRPSQARRLEPALAPALRLALDIPDDHAVDPRLLCSALATAARRDGATLLPGREVAEISVSSAEVTGIATADGERLESETVVIAAGSWSGELRGLPEHARVPVRPVKGQLLRLRDPAGPGLVDRVIRMKDAYLVPRGDGRYVLGASVEERGFDRSITAGPLFELLRSASEVVPGLLELEVEEAAAGLRPGTPDNVPIVGPGAVEGLVWATGHHRNGILLAPVTADLVIATLAGEQTDESAASQSPARFAAVPA